MNTRSNKSHIQFRRSNAIERGISVKPPKRRYSPGQFVRSKKDDQLYCVVQCYRLIDSPHEWIYVLEERKSLEPVNAGFLALVLEELADFESKKRDLEVINVPIQQQDLNGRLSLFANGRYSHGDSTHKSNKELLNNFDLVSSGEII